ncbi:right-handed parallel beta-helix repeat-containing protein [Geothrix sp. PMB-07]|uniref:protein kinase domain-containing protein n=1 Tax=Geothrix sp. PMB-07 TaxID=3068640 RepID=UPI0027409E04|nr:protein kinase [Geothrix sp. PMB-07]WLT32553.1 protein kinase [Geothrix sp. PMB-07]
MRERLGKFEVVRLLGKGAMGEVYLGRDPKLGREVALKVVSTGSAFGEEANARFEREARAAALLNHPHIVTVFEFGEDEGTHYLAMEYIQGEELEAIIRARKAPKAELLEVLAQVCEGLSYAHEHGVIHRDIKPANILVTRQGKRVRAKLMDFGVAQLGPSGLTQAGTWMGTVSYMAPEYLDSGQANASSDMFALGVILYEILTGGRKPFQGDSTSAVLNRILLHPHAPLVADDLRDVPRRLQAVVERALAKRPEDRYPDAEALGTAIRDALAEPAEPVPSLPLVVPAPAEREATGQRIRVGKGGQGQCLSLKVAMRQARNGTEIILLPGIYRESVVVDKDVTILALGEPGEVVIEGAAASALIIQTPAAILRGLTLTSTGTASALRIQSGSPLIEGCLMRARSCCAELEGAGSSPLFRDCTFLAEGAAGLRIGVGTQARVEGGHVLVFPGVGITVEQGAQVSMQGVAVGPGEGLGLKIRSRGHANLDGCSISAGSGSVEVEGDGRVQLNHCRLMESRFAGLVALEHSQAVLESCDIDHHVCSGVHVLAGANVFLKQCRINGNAGFGVSIMDRGLATLEGCLVQGNGGTGLLIHHGATVQARSCSFSEGKSLGVDCAEGGQGVLDACEVSGNGGAGVQVEPGGSLLLVRCTLKEGRDTGLLLLEDSQVTLEECVVHRNARGGILLAKEAADPILRGGNRIEDGFLRVDASGNLVRLAPL